MKNLILILVALVSLNLMAATQTCKEQVQNQVDSVTASDYNVELEGITKNQTSFDSNIYDSGISFNLANKNIKTFRANSSAMGCYGTEYVVFDETSCTVQAIGNGYCD
jgi:hypothetical protein